MPEQFSTLRWEATSRRLGFGGLVLGATLLAALTSCGDKEVDLGATATEPVGSSNDDTGTSTLVPTDSTSGSTEIDDGAETSNSTDGATESSTGELPGAACETESPAAVLFINFDGADLVYQESGDDATENKTGVPELDGPFPAYGEDEKRNVVFARVREIFSPYNIAVVDERPPGQYAMVMVGPHPYLDLTTNFSFVDCLDLYAKNVGFAGLSATDGWHPGMSAALIAGAAGFGYGLEAVEPHPEEVMSYEYGVRSQSASFTDACIDVYNETPSCNTHDAFCSTEYEQNSHAELLDRFGPCPQ